MKINEAQNYMENQKWESPTAVAGQRKSTKRVQMISTTKNERDQLETKILRSKLSQPKLE